MFGGAKKNAASGRLQRAQQLRQKRMATKSKIAPSGGDSKSSSASAAASSKTMQNDDDDETLVVSGACTLVCAVLIVCVGAAMATVFFMVHQPECMKGMGFQIADAKSFAAPETVRGSTEALKPKATENLRKLQRDPTVAAAAAQAVAATTQTGKLPPQCTSDQMTSLARQLPAAGCESVKNRPWRREKCSFSEATSCTDPTWMREWYAQQALPTGETFTSIIVGCNKGYQAVDMLHIGSKNAQYNLESWRTTFMKTTEKVEDNSSSCPAKKNVNISGSPRKAKVYCVEPVPNTFKELERTKKALQIGDELALVPMAFGMTPGSIKINTKDAVGVEGVGFTNWNQACFNDKEGTACVDVPVDTVDHWLTQQTDVKEDDPIHYLSVAAEGHDYEVLVGSAKTLKRVHYLDLQYHWFGNWGKQSFQDLVNRLKKKGFVCYFTGADENIWRVTDCWQDHYEYRFWANVACINTDIPATEGLSKKMEGLFAQTLRKNVHFGEA